MTIATGATGLSVAVLAALAGRGLNAGDTDVPLPNAGFERAGAGTVDGYTRNGFVEASGDHMAGLPEGWSVYQWGSPRDSRFAVAVETGAGRNGGSALLARNIDASAKGGVYTHVPLEPGTYALSVWTRAAAGKTAKVRVYLGNAYSSPREVGDEWQQLTFRTTLAKSLARAEINVQNASGAPRAVWLDDVSLRKVPSITYAIKRDDRPQRPRTLLFSPMSKSSAGRKPDEPSGGRRRMMSIYIGTYTSDESKGIYRCRFDPATGKLSSPELAAEVKNPSFLCLHPKGRFLYATTELGEGQGGGVSAYAVSDQDGTLRFLNKQPSHGSSACYVSVDASGKMLLVANYGNGTVAAFPIQEDGSLAEAASVIQHEGHSVHKRQRGPHAHSIMPDPSNAYALAADLGTDRIQVYRLDLAKTCLVDHSHGATHPGAGPRHLAFGPNGSHVYAINELDSTVSSFAWDSKAGVLRAIGSLSALPTDFSDESFAAHIAVSRCGRFLYASNRGHDSIFVGNVDADSGKLTAVGWQSTLGDWPRHFTIDSTGRWLLAANQNSDNVVVFEIDKQTGMLKPNGCQVQVSKPVCVCLVEDRSD